MHVRLMLVVILRDAVFQACDKGKSNHAEMFHYSDRLNPQRTKYAWVVINFCEQCCHDAMRGLPGHLKL